jgi:hypothetical protein
MFAFRFVIAIAKDSTPGEVFGERAEGGVLNSNLKSRI